MTTWAQATTQDWKSLASPINPADLLLIEGRHLARPSFPAVIDIEGVGEISALGDGIDDAFGLAVGQRVALPFGGTKAHPRVSMGPGRLASALPRRP